MKLAGPLVLLLSGLMATCFSPCQAQPSHLLPLLRQASDAFYFEANVGQYDRAVRFQCSDPDQQVRLLDQGLSIGLLREAEGHQHVASETHEEWENYRWTGQFEGSYHALVWRLDLLGCDSNAHPTGYAPYAGRVNYLTGDRQGRRATRYREVWYEDCYPGVDLRYYGTGPDQLKYDFIVDSAQAANAIVLRATGIDSLRLDSVGQLLVYTAWGVLTEAAPYAYQHLRNREMQVSAQYRLLDDSTFGFTLGPVFDPQQPVVIDPITLNWSSFYHDSQSDDYIIALERDSAGYVYATGYAQSVSLPLTPGVYQDSMYGVLDAFVLKLAPMGSGLVYATYLGGSSWDMGYGLAIDEQGVVYVAGTTSSTDFPNTPLRFQAGHGGSSTDGFVAALSPNGDSLRMASYLGGSSRDYLYDLERAADGSLYVSGYTLSADYPTTPGALDGSYGGSGDGVVTRIAADGSYLIYSTYLGGNGYEIVNALTVKPDGEAWLTGATASSDFPLTHDAMQDSLVVVGGNPVQDVFLARLSADGSTLAYGSYLGGDHAEEGMGIALAPNRDVVLAGLTSSTDYPTTAGALQASLTSGMRWGEAMITRFDSTGSVMRYSSLYGGNNIDYVKSVQVNAQDEVFLLGATQSSNFPVTTGSRAYVGGYDAFVAVFDTDTTGAASLVQAGLFGGRQNDYPRAAGSMAISGDRANLAITSHSPGMPIVGPTYQGTKLNGLDDTPWLAGVELDNILPVSRVNLQAEWQAEAVAVRWQAEGETPQHLSLERQQATQPWQALAVIPTAQWAEGQYLDEQASAWAGRALRYRLTYRDAAGTLRHSARVEVAVPTLTRADLRVMPNPAQERLTIAASWPGQADGQLQVLDALGRVHYAQTLHDVADRWQQTLDLGDWPAGQYWVLLHLAGQGTLRQGVLVR